MDKTVFFVENRNGTNKVYLSSDQTSTRGGLPPFYEIEGGYRWWGRSTTPERAIHAAYAYSRRMASCPPQ